MLLLLLCNALIQLIEDNAVASHGLLRAVTNFLETLNVQMNFIKRANISETHKCVSVLLLCISNGSRFEVELQCFATFVIKIYAD